MYYYFFITFLEWFEFSVYNSIAPYFGTILGNKSHYIASLTILISFFLRPVGAIFFSSISNRVKALKISLGTMVISTLGLAFTPKLAIAPIWMLVCKCMQGFALGGSYGISYLNVYEEQESLPIDQRRTNYKVAIVQLGWVIGIAAGKFMVLIFRVGVGNFDKIFAYSVSSCSWVVFMRQILKLNPSHSFLQFGWRLPFACSALLASILLLIKGEKNQVPASKRIAAMGWFKLGYVSLAILLLSCSEFVLFYTNLFVQMQLEIGQNAQVYTTSLMCLQEVAMIPLFPLFGITMDWLHRKSHNPKLNLYGLVVAILCYIYYGRICMAPSIYTTLFAAGMLSICYVAMIPAILAFTPKRYRYIVGPVINMGSVVGGGVQFISKLWFGSGYPISSLTALLAVLPLAGILMAVFSNYSTTIDGDKDEKNAV